MLQAPSIAKADLTFTPFRPWFLFAYGMLFVIGLGFVTLTLKIGEPRWLVGVVLAMVGAVVVRCRYSAQAVILRGFDLVLCYGTLIAHEVSIPIWQAELETQQGPFARLCGYGTIHMYVGQQMIDVHTIAHIHALRMRVAERRQAFFASLNPHVHVHAFPFPPAGVHASAALRGTGGARPPIRLVDRSHPRSGADTRR